MWYVFNHLIPKQSNSQSTPQQVVELIEPLEKLRGNEGLMKFAEVAEGVDMATGETFRFGRDGWEWQKDLLNAFYKERRLIILKARQMGITWLAALYSLWKCLVYPYSRVLIVSRNREQASMTLRNYVAELYHRLPKEWQIKTTTQQVFLWRFKNGSEIITQPSTEDSGRGFTGALAIIDEAAYQPYAELTFVSLKPTIDNGGQLIIFSTANGVGNFFHRLWQEAIEGKNGFTPIFLPYNLHPHRDAHWREMQRKEFPEEWMLAQEYPETPDEAFVMSNRPVFSPSLIEQLMQQTQEPLQTPNELASLDPFLTLFRLPEDGHLYVIGADCAEGLVHGDFNAICIIDALTGEQVAEYASKVPWNEFAIHIHLLAMYFQAASVIVERNGIGAAVISRLRELGTLNLWRPPIGPKRRSVTTSYAGLSYGWQTTVKTKPILIAAFIEGVTTGAFKIRSKELLKEMSVYQRDDDGNTTAPFGYTDDRIMAAALAWFKTRDLMQRRQNWRNDMFYTSRREESWFERALRELENEQAKNSLIRPTSELVGKEVMPYDLSIPL